MAHARTYAAGVRRGRPRKPGERWPSGALKPPPPNPIVIAARRARVGPCGDLTQATTDLDVALARGWLTPEEHQAARDYAGLYRRAGVDLPRLRARDLGEAAGEHAASGAPADAPSVPRPAEGDPAAQTRLRTIWSALDDAERRALAHACLADGDLDFVQLRCRGLTVSTRAELDLKRALAVVQARLDPRRGPGAG